MADKVIMPQLGESIAEVAPVVQARELVSEREGCEPTVLPAQALVLDLEAIELGAQSRELAGSTAGDVPHGSL